MAQQNIPGTKTDWQIIRGYINNMFTENYGICKSFNNASLDANYALTITTPPCIAYEITILKPDGRQMVTQGLVEKTSATQLKVHFGEPIADGTWYYIVKYHTATT